MKISILIPCHNEEIGLAATVRSCFMQTRKADEIVLVDDGSSDTTRKIIYDFAKKNKTVVRKVLLKENTGIKSKAQEKGFSHVTGDVFVTVDADSQIAPDFLERVERAFHDKKVAAFSGNVRSIKHNTLTACRELEYTFTQKIFKYAQSLVGFVYIIPGCAGAFRRDFFLENVAFGHDTVAEDLDFSYQINATQYKIIYDKDAIVYTNDPATLRSYIGQMRRWYGEHGSAFSSISRTFLIDLYRFSCFFDVSRGSHRFVIFTLPVLCRYTIL